MTDRFTYMITEKDIGLPIKELLKRRMGMSSRLIRKLKKEDRVKLNGNPVKLFEKGKVGDCVSTTMPEEVSGFEPEAIPIHVLYEDEDLLAVNKQPGLVVHPTKGHPNHTIANGIMRYMLDKGETYKIRFINRLDRDTSGILLIGKNSHSQDDFARQAMSGLVIKKYVALVYGHPADQGTIDKPIGKPVDDNIRRAVIDGGYPSITHYRVINRYAGYSLIELMLETGRTHQIRVHMAHLGHPIVGDDLYGYQDFSGISRQALHAVLLEFDHPVSGERLSIRAPLPKDMDDLIRLLH